MIYDDSACRRLITACVLPDLFALPMRQAQLHATLMLICYLFQRCLCYDAYFHDARTLLMRERLMRGALMRGFARRSQRDVFHASMPRDERVARQDARSCCEMMCSEPRR